VSRGNEHVYISHGHLDLGGNQDVIFIRIFLEPSEVTLYPLPQPILCPPDKCRLAMASDQNTHSEEIQLEAGISPYPNPTPTQTARSGLLPNVSDRVEALDLATPTIPDRAPPLTPNGTATANGQVHESDERVQQDGEDGVVPNSIQQDELGRDALLGIGPAGEESFPVEDGIQYSLREISESDLAVQDVRHDNPLSYPSPRPFSKINTETGTLTWIRIFCTGRGSGNRSRKCRERRGWACYPPTRKRRSPKAPNRQSEERTRNRRH